MLPGLPEAVLLAREQEIADRIALAPQRLDHGFCLVRRHDGVLITLEEDHRLRQPIRVIERRALAIAGFLQRIGSDQPVEIARLEFVGVARERGDVAHAVIASPTLKEVAEGQRRQSRVATGAAAADDASLAVDPSLRGEEPRAGDAIVDVDHAPVQLQTIAVGAAESGAAAVVHVEHRNAAASPVLNAQVEGARRGRRRPAVALDQKRRLLLRPWRVVGIAGRVEQAEGRFPARGWEFHAFDPREVVAEMQVGTIEKVGRSLQHGVPTGREIECHDAGGMVGRTGAKHRAIAHSAHRAEFRERRRDRCERFVRQIQHREAASPPWE